MAKKVDPRDFLINTDYEMDKIVFVGEGIIQTTPGNEQDAYISTGLPFYPLAFGICAYDKDFKNAWSIPHSTDYYMIGTNPVTLEAELSINVHTEKNMIVVSYKAASTASNVRPMYYRVYAFEPTTSNAKVGATKGHAGTFLLNSDHNYRKLYKKGHAMAGETVVINHNLGYIPQCRFWYDWGGQNDGFIHDYNDSLTITDKVVSFTVPSGGLLDSSILHYRVYCDEA